MVAVKHIAPTRIGGGDIEYAQGVRAGQWLFFTGHMATDLEGGLAAPVVGKPGLPLGSPPRHRREGDFSNSKYWYARCADHPVLPSLNAQASAILNPLPADKSILRLTAHGWNPKAFVDFVEELHDRHNDPRHRIAVALQRLEWRVLFEHCSRAAAGS